MWDTWSPVRGRCSAVSFISLSILLFARTDIMSRSVALLSSCCTCVHQVGDVASREDSGHVTREFELTFARRHILNIRCRTFRGVLIIGGFRSLQLVQLLNQTIVYGIEPDKRSYYASPFLT